LAGGRGGNNPVNGISLCQDFHWAFDRGFFTIEDNYNVLVHSEAIRIPVLSSKNGMRLVLPEDERAWPHLDALRYHRDNIFGRFTD
jgi:predicted restriction endonuclease